MRRQAKMMKIPSSKRGSALLIVLGMLSFMIVSAVAFSVYMRMSRAPSSYLRRNVSSQHLVKAALARAIEDVDDKIGNDPYPGVGPMATDHKITYKAHDGQRFDGYADTWNNRVFCPYAERGNTAGKSPDTELDPQIADDSGNTHKYVDFDTTAAVLTLEALGYIPAPIVNQARYWSRRTETARWRRFNYDLGRWAYVAINVSDLLDINSIHAYTNRNSGAFGRLSLASAVKNANGQPQAFDNFVKNRGGTENQVPFTSVMDFNLALQSSGPVDSPFYDWITKGGNNGFYGGSVSNQVAPLLFVTDSWYPSTNQFVKGYNPNDNRTYYLSRPEDQPYRVFNKAAMGALDFTRENGTGRSFVDVFDRYLHLVGDICLYDYLDRDSVPISLALPTVEQTPMIIGITPLIPQLQFTITKQNTVVLGSGGGDPTAAGYWEEKGTQYRIKLDPVQVNINAALLYPFKRLDGQRRRSFTVQAMVRVYLGPDNLPMRIAADSTDLRPIANRSAWAPNQSEFQNNIYTFTSSKQNIPLPDAGNFDMGDDEEALVDVQLSFTGNKPDEMDFVLYSQKEYPNATPPKTEEKKIKAFTWLPYAADGAVATWAEGVGFNKQFNNNTLVPNVSIWLRVEDSDGKTVDLVPATLRDDPINDVQKYDDAFYTELGKMCGVGTPMFTFKMKDFSIPTAQDDIIAAPIFGGGMPINVPPAQSIATMADDYRSIFCYDPRYNFAPEDWYAEAGAADANTWLNNVRNSLLGQGGRDSDVFMFVSNQEYLQSMGELAFLPRVQNLENPSDDPLSGDFFDVGRYNGNGLTFASRIGFNNFGTAANRAFYWRTYRAYRHGDLAADPIYDLVKPDGGRIYDDDGRGPRVNPYTEDVENIFMAAIGNTPYDYWAASTNKSLGTQYANNFAANPAEALKHCFNNDSPLAKVTDKEMSGIAAIMHEAMVKGGGNWLAAYNNLDWYGNGDPQCFLNNAGETQSTKNLNSTGINEVDRKFLYSFWRNCFGNRQQLFIVFVRAEPSVLGGAQQGGRAVALVWRDPEPPAGYADRISRAYEEYQGNNESDRLPPHRTRVLFYHQFE